VISAISPSSRAFRMSSASTGSIATMDTAAAVRDTGFAELERHRRELTAYCYRMLASPFDAEDAVQETLIRGWRSRERLRDREALRAWLYRIATNVCMDMIASRRRRARPMDLAGPRSPHGPLGETLADPVWVEPIPEASVADESDPAARAEMRETIRLAFIAALQELPPRQRAVLILCEVLHWKASEAAELLETSTAGVNSALQRARSTLEAFESSGAIAHPASEWDRELLDRYVAAFESYDMDGLAALIREDATQSMPPYELWLSGRENIFDFWVGYGAGCRGSRMLPTIAANGSPAFGQYKPSESGSGFDPWALQVLEIRDGRIAELTFFLATEGLFPLFGLPPRLEA
jgi:RNA polymerase sigma-70 factor, ECF subfamily